MTRHVDKKIDSQVASLKAPMQPMREVGAPVRSASTASAHSAEKLEHPLGSKWPVHSLCETKTVLIIGRDDSTRQRLGRTLRDHLNCRVVEAFSIEEGRYLAVVEERVDLLVMDLYSLAGGDLEFARWFRSAVPHARVLVAADSLWELQCDSGIWEQVLMAKSYTPTELVSTVRRALG